MSEIFQYNRSVDIQLNIHDNNIKNCLKNNI